MRSAAAPAATGAPAARRSGVREAVVARLGEWYGIDPATIDDDRPFAELGLTSRDAVALAGDVRELTGVALAPTALWDATTLGRLLDVIAAGGTDGTDGTGGTGGTVTVGGAVAPPRPQAAATGPGPSAAPAPVPTSVPVAVIGLGCRLPGGATSPAALWELLCAGRDAVGTVPDDRWTPFLPPGGPAADPAAPGGVSRHGAFLPDIAGFDAEFFGISPHEAVRMDPQQRLLLEVAREGLDHAAIPAPELAGTATGVFVGISGNEYASLTTADLGAVDAWTPPGAALSIAANRLSYALDLRGPSMAVDTACSSSLVAVHHAVRSLAGGETDTALAAGVNLLLSPALTLAFQRAGALAPDGRCKTFDAKADGMVRGEGCVVAVLKRLADAERDGDRVLAVIRGTAVNSDGRSNGLLAPNPAAQRALLRQVHGDQGTLLDYVEAHGTGTALGDPIEAHALGAVLGAGRDPDQPLLLGSAKTNFGHLEAAAGLVGLAKTVLALHHGVLPAHLHLDRPNPLIDFDALGLRVVTGPEPWPRYSGTATAGVSAFGFGGTNAHVALAEYHPADAPRSRSRSRPAVTEPPPAVLVLDAATDARLRAAAEDLGRWLTTRDGRAAPLRDTARTLHGRTGRGRHRAAVVAADHAEAADALTALAAGRPHPALVRPAPPPLPDGPRPAYPPRPSDSARPVWVFSGYGSQWPGMGSRLLAAEPAFAAAVDRLEPLLARHAGLSLRAHLRPDAELATPSVVQPVLFGLQVALAALWRSYGLQPAAVIGHSMGEVAAAVVAGAIDEESGARIIGTRARLLDGLSGGAMAVVELSAAEVRRHAATCPSVRVAVHSSPAQSVVTGTAGDIANLVAVVRRLGGMARPLRVVAAGHSPQVDPLLTPLTRQLGEVPHTAPGCAFYGTVLDNPREAPAFGAGYWAAGLRRPVRFAQAVAAAAADGHRTYVEISAHPTQLHPLAETLAADGIEGAVLLPTLRRNTDDARGFRAGLAAHLLHGIPVARDLLHPGARLADVPVAGWLHRRYWAAAAAVHRVTAEQACDEGVSASSTASATAAAPSTAPPAAPTVLDRLLGHVAQVMGYTPADIDPRAPLTDLGLDSLMAARILAAVGRDFGVAVEPRVLLRHGTVEALAAWLEAADSGPAAEPAPATRLLADRRPRRRVQPRDAAERLVAHAWAAVTGGPPPGAEDDLGLPSRATGQVIRLAEELAARSGHPVTPGELAAARPPTVAAIAQLLRPRLESASGGPVRTLRAEGTRAPLFLLHPAGGSSAVYAALAQRLGPDRPCYGLDRLPDLADVGDRARAYARLIRATRPNGPWVLGGWSYGGLVAQETARLLAAPETGPDPDAEPLAGTVAALVLVDSVLPLPAERLTPHDEALRRFAGFARYVEETYGTRLDLPYDHLAALDDAGQVDLVVGALARTADLPAAVLEHQRASYLDLRSAERHTPRPYAGRTLLYRATEPAPHTVYDPRYDRADPALGWDAHCPDLTVRPLPGHHLALLDPPVVDELAALLARDLAVPAAAAPVPPTT
ncbi:beta-ketoacyl synthase N-terminal-like domain-containing protein [Streptomyces sp. CA2R106]|uniref:beta-ketoacyl synthase N-terminal-like domain-containing protein n=1 Tax=Streptomyces sp. CA2R106 TaxID=3120153 RepID=UPI00300A0969